MGCVDDWFGCVGILDFLVYLCVCVELFLIGIVFWLFVCMLCVIVFCFSFLFVNINKKFYFVLDVLFVECFYFSLCSDMCVV